MALEIVETTSVKASAVDELEKDVMDSVRAASLDDPQNVAPESDPDGGTEPDKYAGKSREQIREMHQNLEQSYGRMANDLGQQRKMSDEIIALKRREDLATNTPNTVVSDDPDLEVTSAELLEKPGETLTRILRQERDANEARQRSRDDQMEARLAARDFDSKYPDGAATANDPNFIAWVQKSPLRGRTAQLAAAGDHVSAAALLDEYTLSTKPAPTVTTDDAGNKVVQAEIAAAKTVGLESGASSTDAGETKGKIYSRAALMEIRLHKPHIYKDEAFQAEILKAYAEDRVR